jgi:predicted HTH transcriptional regulator
MPGGYIERLGSGVSFMIREMRAGTAKPEFREQNRFIVTFHLADAREYVGGRGA